MKINNPPSAAQALEQAKGAERAQGLRPDTNPLKKNPTAPSPSNVEISEDARLMQRARELAHGAPDVRPDKVQSLKKAIQSGVYKVDAESIAEKILEDHMGVDFGKNNL